MNYKTLLIVGVLALLLVGMSGCVSSSPTASPVPTATPTAQATVKATPTVAPTKAAAPTSNTLTAAQLDVWDNSIESSGYTVVKPLAYSQINKDGSTMYSGQLVKGGTYFAYNLAVYSSASAAHSGYLMQVELIKELGYTATDVDATSWIGTKGEVGGLVMEMSDHPPYIVASAFAV